jgi:hypothetical protein
VAEKVDLIEDQRRLAQVNYTLRDCYLGGFALFYLQDPSLLEFQRRFEDTLQLNNLSTVFGVEQIPSDSQLRDTVDRHPYQPLLGVYKEFFSRLQRSKQLESYRYYKGKYLITIDGSEYFSSNSIHCDLCLSKSKSDGSTRYYHQILQPALIHPDRREVIALAPEFIRRQDGRGKDDCEINAGKRAVRGIRSTHRQLDAIIAADSLYSTTPFIRLLERLRYSYLLAVKPGSHRSLFTDVEGMRRGKLLDRLVVKEKARRYVYEWVKQMHLTDSSSSPIVSYIELKIYNKSGEMTRHFSWVSDIEVSGQNVIELVRGARARWKIENEGFNTLKNHGYHLEHNFGHGKKYLSEAFFVLNLLAFFMHQIFELVDGLYQLARGTFSSRREYWNAIRSSFRLLLFESWDQVLKRIHGPPQPAFS